MRVFFDTSFFVAGIDARDQWHEMAERAAVPGLEGVASAPVIDETLTLLQRRGMFSAALSFLRGIRHDPDVRIIYPDAALQAEAWNLFARWGASGVTVVDCMSFAIMRSEERRVGKECRL